MLRCVAFHSIPFLVRCPKVTPAIKAAVDMQMCKDDKTTATQLGVIRRRQGFSLSRSTILCSRAVLGWTFRGSAYCQMIRSENKAKRLQWVQQYADEAESGFLDFVYTDETSIQLETHRYPRHGVGDAWPIVSCRTMIPNTLHDVRVSSSRKRVSTGGGLHQKVQI